MDKILWKLYSIDRTAAEEKLLQYMSDINAKKSVIREQEEKVKKLTEELESMKVNCTKQKESFDREFRVFTGPTEYFANYQKHELPDAITEKIKGKIEYDQHVALVDTIVKEGTIDLDAVDFAFSLDDIQELIPEPALVTAPYFELFKKIVEKVVRKLENSSSFNYSFQVVETIPPFECYCCKKNELPDCGTTFGHIKLRYLKIK